ncbi:chemotaxis protein CheA [Pseudomonadota bacterium]
MAIDISQFLDTFYEESFEGLDIMESGLLDLNPGAADSESINTIFRAAHSIKGGSGTFGLTAVADFTHVLETLLDEMRDGNRDVTQPAVDLMLSSVDVLREMLSALRDSAELDAERISTVHGQLEQMLTGGAAGAEEVSPDDVSADASDEGGGKWIIGFTPFDSLFRTGNDPVRIIRELDDLGTITSEVDLSGMPDFDLLDPEECHMAWTIHLEGDVTEEQIKDVFAWVEDECKLTIEKESAAPAIAENVVDSQPEPIEVEAAELENAEPVASTPSPVSAPEATPAATAAAPDKTPPAKKPASTESGSIRVGIDKVDALINMMGELVITQSMLNQLGEDFSMDRVQKLQEGLAELERHTRELQENVMRIRMLPISFSFNRFPRLVHDLSSKLNKKIELKVSGENTELDKTVMEKIGDPLVHLVRNSLDHGIESPEERVAKGKPETGVLHLNAYHQGGNIVIEITDDGAGLNAERILEKAIEKGLANKGDELPPEKIYDLIFQPGFSTAEQVSDVSGRGVGMDVVRRNIGDLGGAVEVVSESGVGSTFTIRLPMTLAILDGQLVRLGKETYVVPLVSIIESLQINMDNVNSIAGGAELYKLRDDYMPIIRLHEVFNVEPENHDLDGGLLVVVEGDGLQAGIFVDDLLGQQQVVIKSLESNFKKVDGLSGATILGDGTVALILDIPGLVKLSRSRSDGSGSSQVAVA